MRDENVKILTQAEYLIGIERWNEAIKLLHKVLQDDPNDFSSLCLLSQSFIGLKEYENALKYSEKAISSQPENEWGYRLKSIVLLGLDRKKEAVKSAEEAVKFAPMEIFALNTLVFAYLGNKQVKKAIPIAEKMQNIFPESEFTLFALGSIYLQIGDNHQAESNFREALRLNPLNANARNNLAISILRQNNPQKNSILAEKDDVVFNLQEAAKLEPNNSIVLENITGQFSYIPVISTFISLFPFIILCFLAFPIGAIVTLIIAFWAFMKICWEIYGRRRNLPPEMKLFLNSRKNGSMRHFFDEFTRISKSIFRKTVQPHFLAVVAVLINLFAIMGKGNSPLRLLAITLIIGSGIWLTSKLGKD